MTSYATEGGRAPSLSPGSSEHIRVIRQDGPVYPGTSTDGHRATGRIRGQTSPAHIYPNANELATKVDAACGGAKT